VNHHYQDIRSRIPEPPLWWDEFAVPRYCPFAPREAANIYAQEVVLLRIECQRCAREFDVAGSWSMIDEARGVRRPSADVSTLCYGDPPHVDCCPAGPTMNSIAIRVLEFWTRDAQHEWVRIPGLEIDIRPDWAEDR
jgi:hypothetical protein